MRNVMHVQPVQGRHLSTRYRCKAPVLEDYNGSSRKDPQLKITVRPKRVNLRLAQYFVRTKDAV